MRFQKSKSSCGPAALANALECLGIRRTEEELQALCKTTATDGTAAASLVKAAQTIEGVRGLVIEEARPDVAMLRLLQSLYEGRPLVVAVNSQKPWDHYAVAAGVLGFGQRINCIDSSDNDLVCSRTIDEFIVWWRGPDEAKKPFWGLVV